MALAKKKMNEPSRRQTKYRKILINFPFIKPQELLTLS